MSKHMQYDKNDELALRNSAIPAAIMNSEGARFDSAEDVSVFFARELDYVKKESYDVEYPEFTALHLFPQSSEADPGAETITYYTYDKQGLAKVIDNYSTDLPRADVIGKPSFAQIKSLGASYGYSAQEMRASRLAGKSLDTRKSEAARFQIDNLTNRIAWAGDEESGLMGILSEGQGIPQYTILPGAITGAEKWADKDPDEIIADITGMMTQMSVATAGVETPDTLALPKSLYITLQNKRIPGTATSMLKYIQENIPDIKDIVRCPELENNAVATNPYAAAEEGAGVIVLFKNDRKKLTLENPMPYYQYPVQPNGLEVVVPCEARTAGVIVYYPMSVLIAVGVC